MTRSLTREGPRVSWRTMQKVKGASFTFPFVAGFALFTIVPVVLGLGQSLFVTRTSGLGFGGRTERFGGAENFLRGLSDPLFWNGLLRVALYAVVVVPVGQLISLVMALLMDVVRRRTAGRFRVALLLPYMVPGIVATTIWIYLYSPVVGPLRPAFGLFGIDVDFFSGAMVWVSIGNLTVWGTIGFTMLILYGSLQSVPREIFEAARIDGASEIRIARSIKVPFVRSSLVLTSLLSIIGSVQLFNEPTFFRSISPQTISRDFTPAMMIYDQAFAVGNLNYAAALSIILAAVVGLASAVIYRFAGREQS